MELFLSLSLRSAMRSLNLFFFTVITAITAIVATIWKPGLRDRNAYTTLTDDLSLDRKCMCSLSELGVKEVKF